MEKAGTHQRVLFSVFVALSFLFNITLSAQTVHSDYWDGKMYFKISEKSVLQLPDFEAGVTSIEQYPILARMIAQYKIQRIFRPFVKLKTPVFDQTYQIDFAETEQIDAFLRDMNGFLWLEYAEKVPLEKTEWVPNDPFILDSSQWHLTKVQSQEAWDLSTGLNSVVVAVVDDAIKLEHEDLSPNLWINSDEIDGNGIDDDGNGYIDDVNGWDAADNDNDPNPPADGTINYFTHGTLCSGIVGAVTNNGLGGGAISHNVKIMACKGARDSDAALSGVWAAFSYAMSNYPDAINCSWGGNGFSQTYQNLVNEAHNNRGIVIIAAAGNNDSTDVFYPAGYNHVISVAASTQNDSKLGYSNFGSWIDITAPGLHIRTTAGGSNSNYKYGLGTSMACPNVSSLVALMLSYNPGLTPDEVESCLYAGADNIDEQNPDYIGLLGAGRINAFNSLQCVSPTGCFIPNGLVAGNITPTSANITWNALSNSLSYNIRYRIVGTDNWSLVNSYASITLDLTGLASCSQYEYQVQSNCDGDQSNFSYIVTFNTPPAGLLNYCAAEGNSANSEWIAQVSLNTINNSSGTNGGYGDFRCISTDLIQGSSYNITLTSGFSGIAHTEYWRIWIDFNQNSQYDDPSERVYSSPDATEYPANANINIPVSALSGATTMRVAVKRVDSLDTAIPEACGNFAYGEVEDYGINIITVPPPVPAVVVKLRVLLEGCYDPVEDEMTNTLNQVVILANEQPFFREPWNYNGNEAVINEGLIPLNTTDWVLVEAYHPDNLLAPIAQKAAFLRTDGRIYDYDGLTDGVSFTEIEENAAYFFAVKPRSHLAVFTAVPLVVPNPDWYDFTISANQALGNNQQKLLPNGLFVLYGGDLDHNGIINYADFNLFFADNPILGEYISTDINKDARTDNDDFQILRPNIGIIGINNIRY